MKKKAPKKRRKRYWKCESCQHRGPRKRTPWPGHPGEYIHVCANCGSEDVFEHGTKKADAEALEARTLNKEMKEQEELRHRRGIYG
jgi:hypothetical protein